MSAPAGQHFGSLRRNISSEDAESLGFVGKAWSSHVGSNIGTLSFCEVQRLALVLGTGKGLGGNQSVHDVRLFWGNVSGRGLDSCRLETASMSISIHEYKDCNPHLQMEICLTA